MGKTSQQGPSTGDKRNYPATQAQLEYRKTARLPVFQGEKVWEILRSQECYTSITTLAEIVDWCIKNNKDSVVAVERVKKMSKIIALTEEMAQLAGRIHAHRRKTVSKWGMVDSMIYATARICSLNVITKDLHFKGLEGIQLIE